MKFVRRLRSGLMRHGAMRRRKIVVLGLSIINRILGLLPLKVSFFLLIVLEVLRVKARRGVLLAFRPIVAQTMQNDPSFRFATNAYRSLEAPCARVLYGTGAYREASEFIIKRGLSIGRGDMSAILARSFFELGEFEEARSAIAATWSALLLDFDPSLAAFKAKLDLIAGDEAEAEKNLARCVAKERYLCPHQNIAARYPEKYAATAIDRDGGVEARVFDACNLAGQRVTHVGAGHLGAGLFARALKAQENLRTKFPMISPSLQTFLAERNIVLSDLRIIPIEWFTQIGHLGMLDMQMRMRQLGWWTGTTVFLVTPSSVANAALFRLFEDFGLVLTPGGSIPLPLARELFSLQRWSGMSFNAFKLPSGEVVPWQEAGALMIRQWEKEGRPYPLREELDRGASASIIIRRSMDMLREKWGMKPDDWYVCLHLRDAAHYGELSGTGQTHRNSKVSSYVAAIQYVTDQGGWVIKLGGPKSPKLPMMKNVIDYARDGARSEVADLDLIRHAKLFIGTTSGLTNVAVSFGIPCALVNCITTDAQLWGDRVRFALKQIQLREGSVITQRELTTMPWRWRVFDAEVLGRFGAVPQNNTSDEILETVKEALALAQGKSAEYLARIPDSEALLDRWEKQLGMPHFYGNGLPSRYFLQKHQAQFLLD